MISDSNPNPFENQKGCGQCLREARERAGLTLEGAAAQLRMPIQVVRALEQEDWQKLGAPVFVRGQLRSYARLLKVDLEPLLEAAPIAPVEPVKLVSHTHTPKMRRVLESTARRAVYVVMTGVLAIPVWYATRSHFDGRAPSTASLDEVPPEAAAPVPPDGSAAPAPAAETRKPVATPYIASMAPVPRPEPAHDEGLTLQFNGDSWVQISAPDGSIVEKALVKAGEQRQYAAGQVARVVLGNASAVEVQQAGSIVDVKPFQRANVARFAVSSDGSVVPASE
ncbi:MAG: RodZ domain-containing protein [Gammaproteobacteria bacterium]